MDDAALQERAESRRQDAIYSLLSKLDVTIVPQSLVFEVSVTAREARKSVQIANTLVDFYILNQLEVKFDARNKPPAG